MTRDGTMRRTPGAHFVALFASGRARHRSRAASGFVRGLGRAFLYLSISIGADTRKDKIVGFHDATRLTTLRNSAMPGSLTPRHKGRHARLAGDGEYAPITIYHLSIQTSEDRLTNIDPQRVNHWLSRYLLVKAHRPRGARRPSPAGPRSDER